MRVVFKHYRNQIEPIILQSVEWCFREFWIFPYIVQKYRVCLH